MTELLRDQFSVPNAGSELEYGLCRQIDPELFFPEQGQPNAAAKRICMMCDITEICLNHALDNRIDDGVWGGKSKQERRQLLRGRKSKHSL